jgi:hypothetical protein
MMARLPVAAVTMLVLMSVSAGCPGDRAILAEVLSLGPRPVAATLVATFRTWRKCKHHVLALADADPVVQWQAASDRQPMRYTDTLRCFPSRDIWASWLRAKCLDKSACT